MIFTSFEYVLFFSAVLLVRSFMRNFEREKWFLLVASYVFYMSWSVPCGFLILATSLIDALCRGLALVDREWTRSEKGLLITSIVANLGVLGYFKYTNFLLQNVRSGASWLGFDLTPLHYDILLTSRYLVFTIPKSMTYTIEAYRGNIKACHSPRDFLLFVAFFLTADGVSCEGFATTVAQRIRATAVDLRWSYPVCHWRS